MARTLRSSSSGAEGGKAGMNALSACGSTADRTGLVMGGHDHGDIERVQPMAGQQQAVPGQAVVQPGRQRDHVLRREVVVHPADHDQVEAAHRPHFRMPGRSVWQRPPWLAVCVPAQHRTCRCVVQLAKVRRRHPGPANARPRPDTAARAHHGVLCGSVGWRERHSRAMASSAGAAWSESRSMSGGEDHLATILLLAVEYKDMPEQEQTAKPDDYERPPKP
ncbi:hypothetical protein J7J08_05415 [Stenotrophomonas sp. ISL-67]|uniref:hypothetical protein n=1 Tax=Stenotrophomonas sp. ISL-67 TaxID=2819171 RepID=UPI001BE69E9A|nr:hypothetical protein [Stenotrophomonas sp. ISL-67]MBT2767068.1 hypothetical protein [Stenotrophomonas sp. ISL-67]